VTLLLGTLGPWVACGTDDRNPAPSPSPSAGRCGRGSVGESNSGGSEAGADPVGGSESNEAGSTGELGGEGNLGGRSNAGSSSNGDAGASLSMAGGGAETGSGEAGSGGTGGPVDGTDLIVVTGGPWPDSFTGNCATPMKLIPCPRANGAFFGQDGNYRINVPTYTATTSTLHDSVTGLTWQLEPEKQQKPQAEAVAYCDGLSLADRDDWRLPTRLEYITMLDAGLPGGFAVPVQIPSGTTGEHWTASAAGISKSGFFVVDDASGTFNVAVSDTKSEARCVRGPTLSGTLAIGDDTVIDSMTGLEWQRTSLDDRERTWKAALAYCESLIHSGKDDWRLPNIKELATIIDESATLAPVVDAATFGDSSASRYWSSSPALTLASERLAFTLDAGIGNTPTVKMTEFAAARCVRTAD
jgi:hypothetical protein